MHAEWRRRDDRPKAKSTRNEGVAPGSVCRPMRSQLAAICDNSFDAAHFHNEFVCSRALLHVHTCISGCIQHDAVQKLAVRLEAQPGARFVRTVAFES